MNSRSIVLPVVTLLLFLTALPAGADSARVRQLQLEVQKLKAARDNLEAAYWNEKKRFIDRKQRDAAELKRLDDTLQDLVSKRNRIREEQLKFRRRQEDVKRSVQKLDLEIAAVNNAFLEIIKELRLLYRFNRPLLPPSLPGELERLSKAVKQRPYSFIKNGGELLELVQRLIKAGNRAELISTQLAVSGERLRDVWLFRISRVYLAYITRDWQQAGILLHGSGKQGAAYRWHEQLPDSFRGTLQQAVQQLLAGSSSELVRLPFDVLLSKAVGERYSGAQGSLWSRFAALIRRGGPVMIPLLLIALVALGIVIERTVFFRRNHLNSDRLMAQLLPRLEGEEGVDPVAVAAQLKINKGPLPRLLRGLLAELRATREEAYTVLQELMLHELPVFERRLSTLKVLGAVAPLLGLLGTVSGMISLFDVITLYGTKDPRLMAGGISEALITTQTGLIIAVPVILAHRLLLNRVNAIGEDLERYGLAVLNRIWKGRR